MSAETTKLRSGAETAQIASTGPDTNGAEADNVVDICDLSRQFGKTLALDRITLSVRPGLVCGLVGSNGAGKSTLIGHVLGLMKAQRGTVRVFGMDPVKHPVEVLGQIGYLSEERDLPDWMRVDELLNYSSAFYPSWDHNYARQLLRTFDLDPKKKVKTLSKGMRAQAGLIVAVAHRPRLLLLDEPSTGLDAVVRKDILNEIIRTVTDEGRTVMFSSHLLDEVEQMSDHVFMIDHGRLVLQGTVDEIKQRHAVVQLQCGSNATRARIDAVVSSTQVLSAQQHGSQWRLVCEVDAEPEKTRMLLEAEGLEVSHVRIASLQDVFVARAGRDRQ